MAEPNPDVVKSRPSVPPGDNDGNEGKIDLPHTVQRDAPVANGAAVIDDDFVHLSSFDANASAGPGDEDYHSPTGAGESWDIDPAIQGSRFPVDSYNSKISGGPVPLT